MKDGRSSLLFSVFHIRSQMKMSYSINFSSRWVVTGASNVIISLSLPVPLSLSCFADDSHDIWFVTLTTLTNILGLLVVDFDAHLNKWFMPNHANVHSKSWLGDLFFQFLLNGWQSFEKVLTEVIVAGWFCWANAPGSLLVVSSFTRSLDQWPNRSSWVIPLSDRLFPPTLDSLPCTCRRSF